MNSSSLAMQPHSSSPPNGGGRSGPHNFNNELVKCAVSPRRARALSITLTLEGTKNRPRGYSRKKGGDQQSHYGGGGGEGEDSKGEFGGFSSDGRSMKIGLEIQSEVNTLTCS